MPLSERLQFGEFTVEPSLQRLTRNNEIVPLKPKAWDLLCLLLANRDRVISKLELLDWLWPRQDISESNLSQTIYELRRALGDRSQDARIIETVPRRGYRFIGDVASSSEALSPDCSRSLAVLPFLELGELGGGVHYSLGVADVLITALAGSGGLVVRPLSAILRYSEADQDALEIGQQLQVDSVLEGGLHIGESGIRVTVRLLRVADGSCLWADQFTTPDTDPFLLEDAIVGRVSAAVAAYLTGSSPANSRPRLTDDPEVHVASMKGWYCWNKWTVDAWLQAIRYFQQALSRQPKHAPSLAGLAAAWSTLGIFGVSPPRKAFANARAAATEAVSLAPDYSPGHEILGAIRLFHDWDLTEAAKCVDQAIELAPDSCNARHLRALTIAAGGHNAQALAEIRRAIQLDPQALIAHTDVGYIHYWGRRYAQAEQAYREVLTEDSNFVHARQALAYVLAELGKLEEALNHMQQAVEQSGRDPKLSGDLAWLLGRMGWAAEAREIVSALVGQSRSDYIDPYQLALGYIGLGDHGRAFDMLYSALRNRSRDLMLMPINPVMDPIRSDDRYAPFLEEAGLSRYCS